MLALKLYEEQQPHLTNELFSIPEQNTLNIIELTNDVCMWTCV